MKSKITVFIIFLFMVITISAPLSLTLQGSGNYIITIDVCHNSYLAHDSGLDIPAIFDGQVCLNEKPIITKLIQRDIKDIEYITEFIIDHPPQSFS
jgi:hypothetical protein